MKRRIYGFIYCACFLSWYNDKSIEHPYLYTYEEASWVLSLYLLAPNVVTALGKVHKSHFTPFLIVLHGLSSLLTWKRMILIDSTWEGFEMRESYDIRNSQSI